MLFRRSVLACLAASASAAGVRQLTASSKFTGKWDDTPIVAADCINEDQQDSFWASGEFAGREYCTAPPSLTKTLDLQQVAPMAIIKIPQQKEVLVTLSSEIAIITVNTATSKKTTEEYYGNIGATSAMAGVSVMLKAVGVEGAAIGDEKVCAPGEVTMASRLVELRTQIGGSATYVDCIDDDPKKCVTKVADLELEHTIGVAISTTAAHSFQWVCPNLNSGGYNLVAEFSLSAVANDLCQQVATADCTTINDFAGAKVVLGKRLLSATEVRAVKGSLEV